jgi:two-component sensor histidine kinase
MIDFDHLLKGGRRVIPPGSARAYAVAVFLVLVASLARWALGFINDDVGALTLCYPAFLFAALVGGFGPGLFAALLGGLVAWWAFMPPFMSLAITSGQRITLLTYLFASLLMVWGADHYRAMTRRLEDEEALRKLAVDELSHRLKNKLATILSIVSFQLREYPEIRAAIEGRLMSLSATDDLIRAANGEGARIRDILTTELGPYEISRVNLSGPNTLLPAKLALSVALLVHELATNAAKYGALSNAAGKVSVAWTRSDDDLQIKWLELDGPMVETPTHRGFGTRLLARALDSFNGAVELSFEPAGLRCDMRVAIPPNVPSDISAETRSAFP